ncbi:MAG TPA: glycosyltransferase [Verrucomicrobiota bacterium]|nr:glycosyltransferase [Verrucomicrobiota bacterium]
MKLLVFAHTPPPLHGQSYMVQLMLAGFGGNRAVSQRPCPGSGDDHDIECYHVNTQFSKTLEDIGEFHSLKLFRLFRYCLQAIWFRFRYGVENFYYIPGPGKHSALYRDWLVLGICRPFFKRLILHWHAAGLGKWLETSVQIRVRVWTYKFAKHADLSIVLSRYNIADAQKLLPQQVRVVNNGIPDPCPEFATRLLPRRLARFAARERLLAGGVLTAADRQSAGGDPEIVRVLYMAHCMTEKGVFDAVEAVRLANRTLAQQDTPVRLRLIIAGSFVTGVERARFDQLIKQPELQSSVEYLGFVSGAGKERAFRDCDLFCFPTYYLGENQPVNLIEAMAHGLPIVTTRWRSIAEMLPPDYPWLVAIKSPEKIAAALLEMMRRETGERFRQLFQVRYTLTAHLTQLAEALHAVEIQPCPPGRCDLPIASDTPLPS